MAENLPSPAGARDALLAGEVDAAWEYTGPAYINYLKHDKPIDDPMAQYQAVKDEDLARDNVFWTEPAPFDAPTGSPPAPTSPARTGSRRSRTSRSSCSGIRTRPRCA